MRHAAAFGAVCVILTNGVIRGVLAAGAGVGTVTTLAGGGGSSASGYQDDVGTNALFNMPTGIAVDAAGTVAVIVSRTAHVPFDESFTPQAPFCVLKNHRPTATATL